MFSCIQNAWSKCTSCCHSSRKKSDYVRDGTLDYQGYRNSQDYTGRRTPLVEPGTQGKANSSAGASFQQYGTTNRVAQDHFEHIANPNWLEVLSSFRNQTLILRLSKNQYRSSTDQVIGRLVYRGPFPEIPSMVTFNQIEGEASSVSRLTMNLTSTDGQNGLGIRFNRTGERASRLETIARSNPQVYQLSTRNVCVLSTHSGCLSEGQLNQFGRLQLTHPFLQISANEEV